MACFDVSNIFGEIPHYALLAAIESSGAGQTLEMIVQDMYSEATSTVITGGGKTEAIPIRSGIKQGFPLSGLLFIMAIDPIVCAIQGDDDAHRILAFADDLCVINNEPAELLQQINKTKELLGIIGLRLNVRKCVTLHLSGKTPIGKRDIKFYIEEEEFKPLREGLYMTYTYSTSPTSHYDKRDHYPAKEQRLPHSPERRYYHHNLYFNITMYITT